MNCYDRVNHSYAALTLQAFGVPQSAVLTMISALSHMQFSIRTAFGESPVLYGGSENNPYHGLCQGNGAAPAGWTVIRSANVCRQQRNGHYIPISSAISNTSSDLCTVLYVDDRDLFLLGDDSTTQKLLSRLQKAADCWAGGLSVSGGALKLRKCYNYLVDYVPEKQVWKQTSDLSSTNALYLGNDQIERLSPSAAKRSLGLITCPSGSMLMQRKTL